MYNQISTMKIVKNARDLDGFPEWCVEHFGEVEGETVASAIERFREEQQGQSIKYAW